MEAQDITEMKKNRDNREYVIQAVKTKGKLAKHKYNQKVEGFLYNETNHWEIKKCVCGKTQEKNKGEHIENPCSICGYKNPAAPMMIYGDANEDGKVDVFDATLIQQYEANSQKTKLTDQGLKNADVNADGKVNGTDAEIILKVDTGYDIELPAKDYVPD